MIQEQDYMTVSPAKLTILTKSLPQTKRLPYYNTRTNVYAFCFYGYDMNQTKPAVANVIVVL